MLATADREVPQQKITSFLSSNRLPCYRMGQFIDTAMILK